MSKERTSEKILSFSNSKRKKTRGYSVSYLKLGFIPDDADETKPYCLLCCKSLCNDSMRNKNLEDHLKNVHSEHAEKPLEYFHRLNEHRQKNRQMTLASMFKAKINLNIADCKLAMNSVFFWQRNLDRTQMAKSCSNQRLRYITEQCLTVEQQAINLLVCH